MNEPTVIHLEVPASHQFLNVVGACVEAMISRCEGVADPDAAKYNVQLAIHEVCTNIVDHAYSAADGRINITLTYERRMFSADLRDSGQSFDLSLVASPNLDDPQEHGLGLFLVYQLMDQVEYVPGAHGNLWRLSKQL